MRRARRRSASRHVVHAVLVAQLALGGPAASASPSDLTNGSGGSEDQALRAVRLSSTAVEVLWPGEASTAPVTLERRSAESNGHYEAIAELPAGVGELVDSGLQPSSAYVYRLRWTDAGGAARVSAAAGTLTAPGPQQEAPQPPLGWWRLDEGAGSPVARGSGRDARGGVLLGQPRGTLSARVGGGLELDGFDDFVAVDPAPELRSGFTVAAWVRSGQGTGHGTGRGTVVSEPGRFSLGLEAGRPLFTVGGSETGPRARCEGAEAVRLGEWHHLAGSWNADDGLARLFVDGSEVCTQSAGRDEASADAEGASALLLGRGAAANSLWRGGIDDVRLYDRDLAQREVFVLSLRGDPALDDRLEDDDVAERATVLELPAEQSDLNVSLDDPDVFRLERPEGGALRVKLGFDSREASLRVILTDLTGKPVAPTTARGVGAIAVGGLAPGSYLVRVEVAPESAGEWAAYSLRAEGATAAGRIVFEETEGRTAAAEGGAGDSYTVGLSAEPRDEVDIILEAPEGVELDPRSLTFGPSSWKQPRLVRVRVPDDALAKASRWAPIAHRATSADLGYEGVRAELMVMVEDDDVSGLRLVETDGSTRVAHGASDRYTLALTSQPRGEVRITLVPPPSLRVEPAEVVFGPEDWAAPRTIEVSAVDGAGLAGALAEIVHSPSSADPGYDGLAMPSLRVALGTERESVQASGGLEFLPPDELSLPSVTGIQNTEFTGTASTQIPIAMPPLPAGFPFGLSLGYSSETVNGIRSAADARGEPPSSFKTHSGVYGLGWSVSGLPSITPGPSGPLSALIPAPYLNMGGESRLLYFDFKDTGQFVTQPLSFYRVTSNAPGCDWWSGDVRCSWEFYWGLSEHFSRNERSRVYQVWDGNGNRYTFGEEQRGYDCNRRQWYALGFHPTEIEDRNGNRLVIRYFREEADNGKCSTSGSLSENYENDRAIIPDQMLFYPQGASKPTVAVTFEKVQDRPDGFYMEQDAYRRTEHVGQPQFSKYRVQAIVVSVKDESEQWQQYRRYELDNAHAVQPLADDPDTDADERDYGHMLLRGVTIRGASGAAYPSYRFEYNTGDAARHEEWNSARLARVDNGYSGQVRFDYALVPFGCYEKPIHRYAVTAVTTYDGVSPAPSSRIDYEYQDGKCRVDKSSRSGKSASFWFMGYGRVLATSRHADGDLRVETEYETVQTRDWPIGPIPHAAAGRPKRTATFSGVTPLTESRTEWVVTPNVTQVPWRGYDLGFDWVRKESQTQIKDGRVRKTLYKYDSAAFPFDYGFPTEVVELGDPDPANPRDDLRVRSSYLHNPGGAKYLLGLKSREETFAWDGTPGVSPRKLRDVLYLYDVYDHDPNPDVDWGKTPEIGRLSATVELNPGGTPDRIQTNLYYDGWGNRTRLKDPRGFTSETVFDPLHHAYALETVNPLEQRTHTDYDFARGVVESQTDPNGRVTRYEYDAIGRRTRIFRPGDGAAASTEYEYSPVVGAAIAAPYKVEVRRRVDDGVEGVNYARARSYYDGLGREIQKQSPGDSPGEVVVVNSEFNSKGLLARESHAYAASDSGGYLPPQWPNPTVFASDALSRPTKTLFPDGRELTLSYQGWNHTVEDSLKRRKTYIQDAFGRVTNVIAPEGSSLQYVYDGLGQLRLVKDAAGNETTMEYDGLGRKTRMIDPDMGTWSYEYDAAGNLTQQTDARGVRLAVEHDALNRQTQKHYSDGTPPVSFRYDEDEGGIGHRTTMVDAAGAVRWSFDERGRMTRELRLFGGPYSALRSLTTPTRALALEYRYDLADRIRATVYPDGELVSSIFNQRGLEVGLSNQAKDAYVREVDYDVLGRPLRLELGSGLVQGREYYAPDERVDEHGQGGRLKRIQVGEQLLDVSYVYDAAGNVLALSDLSQSAAGEDARFRYDGLNRLTAARAGAEARAEAVALPPMFESYSYDPSGNLTSRNGELYTYGAGAGPHAVTAAGADRYQYDAAGNMVFRLEGTGYSQLWDADSRLAQVSWPGGASRFVYDGNGRRVLKIEATDGETTTAYIGKIYEESFDSTPRGLLNRTITATEQAAVEAEIKALDPGTVIGARENAISDGMPETTQASPASARSTGSTLARPIATARGVEATSPSAGRSVSAAEPSEVSVASSRHLPLGWWSFDDGSASLDRGRGAHPLESFGSPVPGERDGSRTMVLNGADAFLSAGADETFHLGQALTIAGWVRPARRDPSTSLPHPALLGRAEGFALRLYSRTLRPEVVIHLPDARDASEYGYVSCKSTRELEAGQWVHLAGSYDASQGRLRVYVGGSLEVECPVRLKRGDGTITGNKKPLEIGRWYPNRSWLEGSIDDVRLYDFEASDVEVTEMARGAASPRPGAPSGVRSGEVPSGGIGLGWEHSGVGVDGFVIERRSADSNALFVALTEVANDRREFTDSQVAPGALYQYRLRAYGPSGFSPYSAVSSTVVTDPQGAPASEPLGWWRFDEPDGDLVPDHGSAPHPASLVGGPQRREGRLGGALTLDGLDDYALVGTHGEHDLTDAITISAWVEVLDRGETARPNPAILGKPTAYALRLESRSRRPALLLHIPDAQEANQYGYVTCSAAADLPAGWHHVAGTYSRSSRQMRVFVDGTEVRGCRVSRGSARISTSRKALEMGRWTPNENALLRGAIDDVRLFGVELAHEQIFQQSEQAQHAVTSCGPLPTLIIQTDTPLIEQGQTFTVTNAGSAGPPDTEIQYRWSLEWGDGERIESTGVETVVGSLVPLSRDHRFATAGAFELVYEVDVDSPVRDVCEVRLPLFAGESPNAPQSSDDLYRGKPNEPWTIDQAAGVLGNDVSPAGATLTAELVSGPAHGTLVLESNGGFRFDSAAGFVGSDSFIYRAFDGVMLGKPTRVGLVVDVLDATALLAHYALDEDGGSTALDSSSRGHHGVVDGAARVFGVLGRAVRFDGNDDRITVVLDGDDFAGLEAMTLTAWLRSTKLGSAGVLSAVDERGNRVFEIDARRRGRTAGDVFRARFRTEDGEDEIESSENAPSDAWRSLAIVWQRGSGVELYLDGALDTPSYRNDPSADPLRTAHELRIGAPAGSSSFFPGLLDEVRFYGRALSAEEIGALDRASRDTKPPSLSEPGLGFRGASTGISIIEGQGLLFYGPAASGSLDVTVVAEDAHSGLEEVVFPDVFVPGDGSRVELAGEKGPESLTHAYDLAGIVDGVFDVLAIDQFANRSTAAFGVTYDGTAPTARLDVPEIAYGAIPIDVEGEDQGAGIRHFEIQVRSVEDAEWTTVATVSAGRFDYIGAPNQKYLVRARALDLVDNASEWVASGPVELKPLPVRKYYRFSGATVAMRRGVRLFYLHGDQLGSSSLVTDADGEVTAETRYLPFGQRRWQLGDTPTDLGFTGQREERAFGLIDYNARYYNPRLGRFVSPDTIVPEQGDPQAYNRYAYVSNNPMKFVDPSGHCGSMTAFAFSACKNVVLTLAPAVHKANEYREAIFFPDAQTTFADRLEASAAVGVGATVTAAVTVYAATTAIPAAVSYVTPHVYSAHAAWMTFAASRPFWAGVIGGVAKEVAESLMTGDPVDPRNLVLSAVTDGIDAKASAEPPAVSLPSADLSTHPLSGLHRLGQQDLRLAGGAYPDPDSNAYFEGKGRFFDYAAAHGGADLNQYLGAPPAQRLPWKSRGGQPSVSPAIRKEFYRVFAEYHSFSASEDAQRIGGPD